MNSLPPPDAADRQAALSTTSPPAEPPDGWTADFARTLQAQHARVREFLQAQRDRWRQMAGQFTRQIETLQAEVQALQASNECLRAELLARPAEGDRTELAEDASRRYQMAMDDIRDLKARNTELQRQLRESQSGSARRGAGRLRCGRRHRLETQKRRLLAELDSDDQQDAGSTDRRLKIEEIVARTDKIIAEKNREIEELITCSTTRARASPRRRPMMRPWNKCSTRTRSSARSGSGCSSCRTSVKISSARRRSSFPWSGHGLPVATPRLKRSFAMPTSSVPRPRPRPWHRPAGRSAAAGGRSWA